MLFESSSNIFDWPPVQAPTDMVHVRSKDRALFP